MVLVLINEAEDLVQGEKGGKAFAVTVECRSQRMNGLFLLPGGFAELFLSLNSRLIEMTQ